MSAFLKDKKAATAIEFGITAPVYLFSLLGAFELAILLLSSVVLEGAVSNAARENITGASGANESRAEMLARIIAQDTLGVLNQNNIVLTSSTYLTFSDLSAAEEDAGGVGGLAQNGINPGGAGELVLFKIRYEWQSITPFFGMASGSGLMRESSVFQVQSYALVKNEPF